MDELARLFVATTEHAAALKAKVQQAVANPASPLRAQLTEALQRHVANVDWDVSEVTASSGRAEAEVSNVEMSDYEVPEDQTEVWSTAEDRTTWLVELTANVRVTVQISVSFYIWDSIDREELSFGHDTFDHETDLELKAYLTCTDVKLDGEPGAWEIETDLASGDYSVGEMQVEQDFGRGE